jgi:GNAT superfamily N-acetyltransferase
VVVVETLTRPYWITRLLRAEEADAMADLSRYCFGQRADSPAFIRSRYTHSTGPASHVMAAEADGQLIGTQAVCFLPGYVAGCECVIGMFTAGMTHPDHRRRGVFRDVIEACARFAFEQGAGLLFTMPNEESFPAFQRMTSWYCLPDRRLRALPLDAARLLRERNVPGWLARPVGSLAHLFLAATRRNRAGRSSVRPGIVEECREPAQLADAFDALAEQGRRHPGILCRRDWAFLRWRFLENPTYRYRLFVARSGDVLNGYLVTTTEQRKSMTLTYVVDWLVAERPGVLDDLLAAAAHDAHQSGSNLLGVIASEGADFAPFAATGFRTVPPRLAGRRFHTAVCVHPERCDLTALAHRDDRWYLTLADFDTI